MPVNQNEKSLQPAGYVNGESSCESTAISSTSCTDKENTPDKTSVSSGTNDKSQNHVWNSKLEISLSDQNQNNRSTTNNLTNMCNAGSVIATEPMHGAKKTSSVRVSPDLLPLVDITQHGDTIAKHLEAEPDTEAHERFFTKMLAEIDTPALAYGLSDVHQDGMDIIESHLRLSQDLNDRLRGHARRMGVSLASLFHLVWAQVVSRTSGQERVVLGTVLFGDTQGESFINTLPIRIDVGDASVEDSVRQTQADLAALLEHEHASLSLAQRCSSVPAGTSLFTSLLSYRHSATKSSNVFDVSNVGLLDNQDRTNYPFIIFVEDGGDTLGLTSRVVKQFDSKRVCGYMNQALQSLVDALDHTPKMQVRDLEILPNEEREMLLRSWNTTNTIYTEHFCIHQTFESQVEQSPDAIAVVYGDQEMTYRELNERANSLAHRLVDLGVKPDSLVAISVSRSMAVIIAVLAVLKAGGAYVPLDPTFASERLNDILVDASPSILLADDSGVAILDSSLLQSIQVVDPNMVLIGPTNNPFIQDLTPRHLAYVIYTSGSTGKPKGVMVEHAQVTRLFEATAAWYNFDKNDTWIMTHTYSFDVSVWEIWGALKHGGKLVIPSYRAIRSPEELYGLVCQHGVTVLNMTPSAFRPLIRVQAEANLGDQLRYIIFAGEALEPAMLQPWYATRSEDSPKMVNMYGTTETTVHATFRITKAEDCRQVTSPIGVMISDLTIYVLDTRGQPAPLGAIGELCISGAGVTRGYLNRPELTSERFPLDPFSETKGARMYKTGDLGRYLPDGTLIFLGRNDHQVKIRGYRVELGEIEARLMDHSVVREAVVVALGEGSGKRLVAYVVAKPTEGLAHTLRTHISSKLPEYMTPAAFVRLDKMPLTPNGKLDRRALPEPDIDSFVSQGYEAPQGEIESALAVIWAELLKVDRVGRNDNFFMLGGHSLLAVQMTERLRRIGLNMSVRVLFDTPTLSTLALSLMSGQIVTEIPMNMITHDTSRITPELLPLIDITQDDLDMIVNQVDGGVANIQDIYALSPLQDGILFHHIMATKGDPYLIVVKMTFDNKGLLDRYLDAFQRVVDRHDILRTAIVWENLSSPAQVVLRHAKLSVTELSLDPIDGPIADQMMNLTDPREHRTNLAQAPLIRFMIARDSGGCWIALQILHHIVSDHSTLEIISIETQAFMQDRGETLREPQPFRNLIAEVRSGPGAEVHEQFFTNMLAEVDTPALPYGLSDVRHDGMDITESYLMLPQDLNSRLRNHAKKMGVSLASLCHLAWAQVISRTSGQEQVVFGTVLFGRLQGGSGSDQALGLYINTLPIRIDVGDASVENCVRKTQADLASLLEHEHASLSLAQRCSSVPSGTSLFSSLLNYRHNSEESSVASEIGGIKVFNEQERTNYPFVISVEDGGDTLGLTSQVVKQFDSKRVCGYMHQALQSLVDALDHTPKMQVRDLEILPSEEREMLLRSWNNTNTMYPEHLCIHQTFESQVEQSPDAIAVVYEGQETTYHELNARANSLAHHLIDLGVKPDSLVAICVDRSPVMIVALLAVLKAGGAYVPLDPSFASGRLHDILVDASPSIVLADISGVAALSSSFLPSTQVVDPNVLLSGPINNPVVRGLMPHHLAYVIYTSGSTGKPKGVMIEHRAVTNLAMSRPSIFGVGDSSRVLQFFSFSFDGSVHDIWSALCFGAILHVLPDPVRQDRTQLWNYLKDNSITQALLTPAVLQDCKDLSPITTPLTIALGGEALPSSLLKTLRALVPNGAIINDYGPTETTVDAISWKCPDNFNGDFAPIGRPNPNKKIYVLDSHRKPVPLGVIGELYIAGAGVARGYLNRHDLTDAAFLPDLFSAESESRMYKTGDLVRYLPDGNLMFLGRNDHQVKIRGYRIELGEIEAQLCEHTKVKEAVVLALGKGSSKRLVAYVVAEPAEGLALTLRSHVSSKLPEYMVPAAFVRLDILPLTPNGKLDRRALPEPDIGSFVRQEYEAPRVGMEYTLAEIWVDILKVDRVGRNDNFFMLGGHSLLAVQMTERLRRIGLNLPVRVLFDTPTLCMLAQSLKNSQIVIDAPKNMIGQDTSKITPEFLPLIDLTQEDIDTIVNQVHGGAANIQDIYAVSPLQDGILFHHIMATKGDPYLIAVKMSFESRDILDRYLSAVQRVVDRHDILRTSIMWENLSSPSQVVLRHARLSVTELSLDPIDGPIVDQMGSLTDPREHRIDLTQAPLIQFMIAQDIDGCWIVVKLMHHIIVDNSAMETMEHEIQMFFKDQGDTLSEPQPFRNLIAEIRLGPSTEVHEHFFTKMLAEIDTPALPYGLSDVHHDGMDIIESQLKLPQDLNNRLRNHAKRMGVSLASLCHLAWAQVVSRTSGQEQVVFGTVLFGRMQGGSGSDQAMGLFINTLPIRIDVGDSSVEESIRRTQADLASLLEHEHASLSLAQRCSGVPAGTPLLSAVLNCRNHTGLSSDTSGITGITVLDGLQRTNYPIIMSVDDFGTNLSLTAQVVHPVEASRICGYMQHSLQSLADALDRTPKMQVRLLDILPEDEREMILRSWNTIEATDPDQLFIHQLFESQAKQFPDSTAAVYEGQEISYHELNDRANSLAHHLIKLGVKPDSLVAVCVCRSIGLIISLLAVLKAGGAYVPLDPTFAGERLGDILADASPSVLLADDSGVAALSFSIPDSVEVVDPNGSFEKETVSPRIPSLTSSHLAYVIYTSGSTGKPKGVMVEHTQVTRLFDATAGWYSFDKSDTWIMTHTFSFDISVWEIWGCLRSGGKLVIPSYRATQSPEQMYRLICEHDVSVLSITPSALRPMIRFQEETDLSDKLRYIILVGEAIEPTILKSWYAKRLGNLPEVINMYGPTETTVYSAYRVLKAQDCNSSVCPIGVRIPDLIFYVLDIHGQPVPLGAIGELCIGGAGVTRGYLNRPELTSERFPSDPFSNTDGARMYKTGDLVRYLPDRDMIFLGRNDHQVKIRGYRIELGEIEARLVDHPAVREVVVLAVGEGSSKRLVAYIVTEPTEGLAYTLRSHISSKLPEYMIPAAFVRLDKLPLTSNGKLDRRALPEPGSDSFVSQGYETPRGEIESTLAEIWAELLKIDRVGRHDNFFMLGGHSLLAVKLIGHVSSRLGLSLKLQTLFEAPTIAELTPRILENHTDRQEREFDVLLPFRSQGNRPPLFCIHPVVGLGWGFAHLSKHLHPEQPLYALQSRGINGNGQLASSIDEMVLDYMDQIRKVQPVGPYHLLGYSFGGSIAHSLAMQLENLGEKVALLALMDSTPDYTSPSANIDVDHQGDIHAVYFARDSDKNTLEEGKAIWKMVENVFRNNMKLARQFLPSIYSGDMTFFRASESVSILDPLSWAPFTLGTIEVHELECGHLELDKPEPMAKIGRVLAMKLEELHHQQKLGVQENENRSTNSTEEK